jgi:cytidyltransferase-like protein
LTIASYPGSFDPITNGHGDVAMRDAHIFETVVLAVSSSRAVKEIVAPGTGSSAVVPPHVERALRQALSERQEDRR